MFESREEAALKLAKKLEGKFSKENAIILALARGGVVTGKIISTYLSLPLDVLVLKKMGDSLNKELALGVVGPEGFVFWNKDILKFSRLSRAKLLKLKLQKEKERRKQEQRLRQKRKNPILKNKTIILVDDGVATGATVLCAQKYLKAKKVRHVFLATPVIASDTFNNIKKYFDMVICVKKTRHFYAVGQFYKNFFQITDEEVVNLLK